MGPRSSGRKGAGSGAKKVETQAKKPAKVTKKVEKSAPMKPSKLAPKRSAKKPQFGDSDLSNDNSASTAGGLASATIVKPIVATSIAPKLEPARWIVLSYNIIVDSDSIWKNVLNLDLSTNCTEKYSYLKAIAQAKVEVYMQEKHPGKWASMLVGWELEIGSEKNHMKMVLDYIEGDYIER